MSFLLTSGCIIASDFAELKRKTMSVQEVTTYPEFESIFNEILGFILTDFHAQRSRLYQTISPAIVDMPKMYADVKLWKNDTYEKEEAAEMYQISALSMFIISSLMEIIKIID